MKRFLFIIGLLISSMAYCQSDAEIKELTFSKVIQDEHNANKTDLYTIMRGFIGVYFKNSQKVIQMDDREAGVIICKGTSIFETHSLMLSSYDGWLDFTLKIQTRDGRVKIDVSNFFHHNKPGYAEKSNLGVLTTSDIYTDKGMAKKYHNKVWGMLKEKASTISGDIFNEAEMAIKKGDKDSSSGDDNW